jgi:colanic acid/amylovoran biosynthesis glycosyltransferase
MQELSRRNRSDHPVLVITPSVLAARKDNLLFLDDKAVSGLRLYSHYWPGRVRCIFRQGSPRAILFGSWHEPASLPFDIAIIPETASIPDALLRDAAVVLGSGDNHLDFSLADQCRKLGVAVIFVIEYTLETRLKIIALSEAPLVKRLKSMVWTVKSELGRRRAFASADALQANGAPAANRYARTNREIITYFDTRLSEGQMVTDQELKLKQTRIMEGAPLRLTFTGRLEKMKGALDLIRIAAALDRTGTDFRLDIYGAGSLEREMRAAVNQPAAGVSLREKVRIHPPVNFDRELVPMMRSEIDLFLCCHPQSDPSCTYMETLGCGVPILGYNNSAWRGILNLADVGWEITTGATDEAVRKIVNLDANRSNLSAKMRNARDFAKAHSFEAEFKRRVDHLRKYAANSTIPHPLSC